ncbi:GntP family permease [Stieleria sp. TO1_6]|uniref:GntP family permease n=1 Tax=Stieleria tagensis TaxID=2956795 RepID=UPI00209AEF7C|nr:gluconate:H+ symporter [Stieleria tagensis]MCO8124015.1 GntP family permease [Stieleria tagensis]
MIDVISPVLHAPVGLSSLFHFSLHTLSGSALLAQSEAAAESVAPVPAGPLIALLVFGIALLLVLILQLKLQAFLSLLVVSVVVAASSRLVNPHAVPITQVADTIVQSMGSALGFIATIIGIGAIFGAILEHSGGTQSLANNLVRIFGPKRASWAMLLTGFIISIPVFLDVALVILAPLLFALARDTKRPFLHFGLPLVAGMAVTHAFVPPTPGPVAVAYLLGVNLGWVILFGVIVGLPTAILCGPWMCIKLSKGIHIPIPEAPIVSDEDNVELPSFGFILFLIVLPIGMILANTIVEQWVASGLPEGLTRDQRSLQLTAALADASPLVQAITFIGHPVIALLTATLVTLYFLGTRRGVDRNTLLEISTKALGPAGIIILITGAGGVFKGVLKATGITDALEVLFTDSGISVLLLAWLFATLIRIAQGSATVAMLTAAGLMANFVTDMNQPQLALITVAIAAGATGFSHVNDSGFWMISRYFQMSEGQTLRTWGVLTTMISVIGFSIAMILWQFVG